MRILQPQATRQMLAATRPSSPFGLRDHALIRLFAQTGLRVSEMVGLDVGHVFHAGAARHQLDLPAAACKGHRSRVIPLNDSARQAIHDLVDFLVMRGFQAQPDSPLLAGTVDCQCVKSSAWCRPTARPLGWTFAPHPTAFVMALPPSWPARFPCASCSSCSAIVSWPAQRPICTRSPLSWPRPLPRCRHSNCQCLVESWLQARTTHQISALRSTQTQLFRSPSHCPVRGTARAFDSVSQNEIHCQ